MPIALKSENIMLHAALIILLLLSSSFGDDAKHGGKFDKNTKKNEKKETFIEGDNSGGGDLEAAKDVSQLKKVEGKEIDISGKVKVDERDEFSGKVILLYHPINTKSHRNQQNAIAEVCQRYNYHLHHHR